MPNSLILSFIGDDKPGLIESISRIVSEHNGNWTESRMSHMSGKFAGIVGVTASPESIQQLSESLLKLNTDTFTITVELSGSATGPSAILHYRLTILGQDRPGIVREVSQALATREINVLQLNTDVTSAPMTAEPLFEASGIIEADSGLNMDELEDALEQIANDLNVDIALEQIE